MKEKLEIIRKALERISVRGREDIEIMGMCMDAMDEMIASLAEKKETDDETD